MIIHLKGDYQSREVWLNGEPLSPTPSQKLINHSPDGFAWGYGGSGPAQLALAILLSRLTESEAVEMYQEFKWQVVARLPRSDFDVKIDLNTFRIIED